MQGMVEQSIVHIVSTQADVNLDPAPLFFLLFLNTGRSSEDQDLRATATTAVYVFVQKAMRLSLGPQRLLFCCILCWFCILAGAVRNVACA